MAQMPLVYVPYATTAEGRRAIEYAANLADSNAKLRVLLSVEPPTSAERGLVRDDVVGVARTAAPRLFGRARRDEHDAFGMSVGDARSFALCPNDILVGNVLRRDDANVLSPQDEFLPGEHGLMSAFIPIGSRASGRYAVEFGLPLLKRLGCMRAVFYHTTYRKPRIASSDPVDHMDPGAVELLADARASAARLGFAVESRVEAASQVVDGICMAALATRCELIVMARGLEQRGVGYADEVVAGSPVPVLVLGRFSEVSR